jgi:mono/diheme cytochrome c family protein
VRPLAAPLLALLSVASLASAQDSAPTYHEDVAPIVQERCQTCHRPGGVGPFSLLTYTDALGNSAMIDEVVRTRRMPPWHADDKTTAQFSNSRVLPQSERKTILDWIAADCPAGDETKAPAPIAWPDPKGYNFEPDAVLQTPIPFVVPASGSVRYQYYRVHTNFDDDRWITDYQVKVDATEVVHHVLIFVVYPKNSDSPRVRSGLNGYFCSFLPGESQKPFPLNSAKFLPKGAMLRFQVHYTPDGEPHTDRVRLALKFAKPDTKLRRARTVALATTKLKIPPGAADYAVRARHVFNRDTILMGLTPHMHLRGKTFNYLLIHPDGTSRELLNVPKWDFNWQNTYRFREPLFVPAGSKMLGLATYDNSTANRANPNPGKTVRFGEQTWDEMMIGYMDTVDATLEERAAWRATQADAPVAEEPKAEEAPKRETRSF